MSIVRVLPGVHSVVFDDQGLPVVLVADKPFESDDPIVKAHAWAFAADSSAAAGTQPKRVTSARIEQATALGR